jgi:site-specific DNA recombinase
MIAAAIYARVSSEAQARENKTSIPEQITACRQHAEQRGYTVAEGRIFTDTVSGETDDRPGIKALQEMVQQGSVQVVICLDIDRLARGWPRKILEMEFSDYGTRVEYVIGGYSDTEEGNLQKDVVSAFAEYENRKRVVRSRMGKLGKVKRGRPVTSFAPLGYKIVRENDEQVRFEIHEEEARIVRMIFEWYLHGDGTGGPMGVRTIAHRLTDMGVPTKREPWRNGVNHWQHNVVLWILSNETYLGTWYFNKTKRITTPGKGKEDPKRKRQVPRDREEWIGIPVPPLVTPEEFALVQERFKGNKERAKRRQKHTYLFSGRLSCGLCGRRLVGKRQYWSHYLYYRCPNREQRRPPCELPFFKEEELDEVIWPWIAGLLTNPQRVREILTAKMNEGEVVALRKRLSLVDQALAEKEAEYQRLLGLYLKDGVPEAMLDMHRGPLEKTLRELRDEQERLNKHLGKITYSSDQIEAITAYCAKIADGIRTLDEEYWPEKKAQISDLLDVRATLTVEGSQRVVHAQCVIEASRLSIFPLVPALR